MAYSPISSPYSPDMSVTYPEVGSPSSPSLQSTAPGSVRMKRQQAVRACSHCKRLHAKCSNERPCKRCENNGLTDTCADSPRKPRMGKTLKAIGLANLLASEKVKQLSIFENPGNLVMTHLDPHTLSHTNLKMHSNYLLPPVMEQCPGKMSLQRNGSAVFKTEKLTTSLNNGMLEQQPCTNGVFSTENIPMIFLPRDDDEPSHCSGKLPTFEKTVLSHDN